MSFPPDPEFVRITQDRVRSMVRLVGDAIERRTGSGDFIVDGDSLILGPELSEREYAAEGEAFVFESIIDAGGRVG